MSASNTGGATPIVALAGWILVSLAAGAVGAIASSSSASFYRELARPAWSPPSWLFGPVWTVLYVLMGIAAWLVWRERERASSAVKQALALFLLQLVPNALWTWFFFAWRMGTAALVDIAILLLLIVLTAIAFARIRKGAALLLLPYLLWVSYAAALTFAIWQRNPQLR